MPDVKETAYRLLPLVAASGIGFAFPEMAPVCLGFMVAYSGFASGNSYLRRHSGPEQETQSPGNDGGDKS